MPEGTEKDLSIDDEQGEEVAGGVSVNQATLKDAKEPVVKVDESLDI
jgi:hypothetical protein